MNNDEVCKKTMNKEIEKTIDLTEHIDKLKQRRETHIELAKEITKQIKQCKQELKRKINSLPEEELLRYGETMGYIKQ